MVYQPPVGARDLLPLDVAQKRWIEDRLQQIFHRWGYHRIITSTLERLDTLMAGGAVQPSTVIQIQNGDDEALGLRPELTASIARAAVTRMAGATYPQRLYYNANVFRRGNRGIQNRQQEYYQAGVELLGVGGVAADAEILLLLWDGLRSLNLGQWYVVLGDAGLTRSLLSEFPTALQAQVREAIAHLDRMALEALPLTPQQCDRALALLDLRGKPSDVLQRVSMLDLTPDQRQTVNQLKTLIELLEQTVDTASLVLDLSLIQTFDYYTGIVFEVVSSSETGKRVLGQGGRYDQLLSLYHPQGETIPGIGFVLNIEDLHQVLLPTGQLPAETPASSWLIAPTSEAAWGAAFAHAQTIRESGTLIRVEVDLVGRSSPDETRRYAQHRRIAQIAWVAPEGAPIIEPVTASGSA
jgi:ATP phosphoribosyltransferase regulatory subunit